MGMDQWPAMLVGFIAGAVLAGLAGWLLQSLRSKRERAHLERVEQARKQAAQQLSQARRQVEQLQRDCHELRAASRTGARPAPAAAPEPAPDSAAAARAYVEAQLRDAADESEKKPTGFADTMILRTPGAPGSS